MIILVQIVIKNIEVVFVCKINANKEESLFLPDILPNPHH